MTHRYRSKCKQAVRAKRPVRCKQAALGAVLLSMGLQCACGAPESRAPESAEVRHQREHDILQRLIEINTSDSSGNTTVAAQAMVQRLREAGCAAADVVVLGPNERKGNMVARYRGPDRTSSPSRWSSRRPRSSTEIINCSRPTPAATALCRGRTMPSIM